MINTPRKQGGGRAYGTPQKVPLKKGLFMDGVWHCNCDPRLPASHFQVRKDGANKGRWFYTCQEPKENGCGFFLWDDDAVGREMRAVINNTRSEPDAAFKTLADATRDSRANQNTVGGHIEASNKWMADLAKKNEDEFGGWDLTADDELVLATAVGEQGQEFPDKAVTLPSLYPETPRKTAKFHTAMTPGSKRNHDEGAWPTPQTGSDDVFGPSPTTRLKGGMWDGNERPGLMSPSATPTPGRFRDAGQVDSLPATSDYDITSEVMELLRDQDMGEDVSSKLREALNRHALKASGIAKGRDITRLALKTKDLKIAELQQKISALESEREMDKLVIRNMKSDIAHSVTSRRGRGRGRGQT